MPPNSRMEWLAQGTEYVVCIVQEAKKELAEGSELASALGWSSLAHLDLTRAGGDSGPATPTA